MARVHDNGQLRGEPGSPPSKVAGERKKAVVSDSIIASRSGLASATHDLVCRGVDLEKDRSAAPQDAFWQGLREQGTELWLDADDIEKIAGVWVRPFSGLLASSLPAHAAMPGEEGDELTAEAEKALRKLPHDVRVREIAFFVTARHALRLAEQFGCRVTVQLPPGAMYDEETAFGYAKRFHEIGREYFVVNVPFTPTGIVVTRKLREQGVPVNLTEAFSARQSYVATLLSNPSFVTLSVGSLGTYLSENELGDGEWVGEKAALASQQEIAAFTMALPQTETRLVVADIHDARQLDRVAGVDTVALSPRVVRAAPQELSGDWASRRGAEYRVALAPNAEAEDVGLEKLWEVRPAERKLVEQMILHVPSTAKELMEGAHAQGAGDLFPQLSADELAKITQQGRIPRHRTWANKMIHGHLAIDSLLTLAAVEQAACPSLQT